MLPCPALPRNLRYLGIRTHVLDRMTDVEAVRWRNWMPQTRHRTKNTKEREHDTGERSVKSLPARVLFSCRRGGCRDLHLSSKPPPERDASPTRCATALLRFAMAGAWHEKPLAAKRNTSRCRPCRDRRPSCRPGIVPLSLEAPNANTRPAARAHGARQSTSWCMAICGWRDR